MPWGIYCSYERDARINFREGSFDWKLKVLVHFLRVKRVKLAPTHALFPPNPSPTNFETASVLEIVQKLDNKNTPQSPGFRRCPGGVSVVLGAFMVLMEGSSYKLQRGLI
jgi:hypothetical protein